MKKNSITSGFIIVFIISILITIPRVINFEQFEIRNLVLHFSYIFILNFVDWGLAKYILDSNWHLGKSLLIYLAITGFFSITYHRVANHFFFHFKLLNKEFPLFEKATQQSENLILFIRGALFSGIIYFVLFYLKLLIEKQNSKLEIEQLHKEKLGAQLYSLKQQISPHFLFNSLSTLRTMVEEPKSKQFINKLSNVYRYLLNLNENDLVSLKEELDFTESYLYILKERFEDALLIENRLPKSIESRKIPPLVLQLLIENAIKHNEISIKKPLRITIGLHQENKIAVSNNIQPKVTTERSTGKGLDNISFRYQIIAGQTISITNDNEVFSVIIPIL